MSAVYRRIWQANRQTGERRGVRTVSKQSLRLGPLTHTNICMQEHVRTQKKHKVPLSEIKKVKMEREREKLQKMGCCLCIFGPGGCMGVTHKHNDSAVGAS